MESNEKWLMNNHRQVFTACNVCQDSDKKYSVWNRLKRDASNGNNTGPTPSTNWVGNYQQCAEQGKTMAMPKSEDEQKALMAALKAEDCLRDKPEDYPWLSHIGIRRCHQSEPIVATACAKKVALSCDARKTTTPFGVGNLRLVGKGQTDFSVIYQDNFKTKHQDWLETLYSGKGKKDLILGGDDKGKERDDGRAWFLKPDPKLVKFDIPNSQDVTFDIESCGAVKALTNAAGDSIGDGKDDPACTSGNYKAVPLKDTQLTSKNSDFMYEVYMTTKILLEDCEVDMNQDNTKDVRNQICWLSMYFSGKGDSIVKYSLVWGYNFLFDSKISPAISDKFKLLQRNSVGMKIRGLPLRALKYFICKVVRRPKKVGDRHVSECKIDTIYLKVETITVLRWEQSDGNKTLNMNAADNISGVWLEATGVPYEESLTLSTGQWIDTDGVKKANACDSKDTLHLNCGAKTWGITKNKQSNQKMVRFYSNQQTKGLNNSHLIEIRIQAKTSFDRFLSVRDHPFARKLADSPGDVGKKDSAGLDSSKNEGAWENKMPISQQIADKDEKLIDFPAGEGEVKPDSGLMFTTMLLGMLMYF